MDPLLVKTPFHCPSCQKESRISVPAEEGFYKITCFYCKDRFMGEFIDGGYRNVKNENLSAGIQTPDKELNIEIISPGSLTYVTRYKKIDLPDLAAYFKTIRFPVWRDGRKNKIILAAAAFILVFSIYWIYGIFSVQGRIRVALHQLHNNQPVVILDRDGHRLAEIFQKKVSGKKFRDYPPALVKTVLGIEDRGFYSHPGVDVTAIMRAMAVNVFSLGFRQGASTVTQQLARILLNDRSRNLVRKFNELQMAFALEVMFSKDEILHHYLNLVYLGHGAFGYDEAARFYFNREIGELNDEELLILGSIAASPGKYSPLKNPELSYRRAVALDRAISSHDGRNRQVDFKKYKTIYQTFGTRSPHETVFGTRNDMAPWVSEHVRQVITALFPDNNLYQAGGLVIETTLNGKAQSLLNAMVDDHIRYLMKSGTIKKTRIAGNENRGIADKLAVTVEDYDLLLGLTAGINIDTNNESVQMAVLGMDPVSGEILFMHGGREFSAENQFNRVTQMKRQTGSTIKGILYAAAIETGLMKASSRIMDAPLYFKDTKTTWTPDNTGSDYDGDISLREALKKSKNSAAVQVAQQLGPSGIEEYFTRFFFPDAREKQTRFRNDLSLALGSLEMSPLEMSLAYAAFANDGNIKSPKLIKKIITADGRVLFQPEQYDEFKLKLPPVRKVIQPDTAEVMTSLLADSASASGLRSSGYTGFVAGKTGTSNENRDAWFIGYRPGLAATVWTGFDNPEFSMGTGAFGGTVSSVFWGKLLKEIDKGKILASGNFKYSRRAVSIRICEESGLAASSSCPHTRNELFVEKFPEKKTCSLNHKGQTIKSLF